MQDGGHVAESRPKVLSAAFVRTVARAGRYGDGRGGYGLSLLVKPMANGRISKTWSQRVKLAGRPNNLGIGRYPVVSLAEARAAALKNVQQIAKGVDPRGGGVPTFEAAAGTVINLHLPAWKNAGRSAGIWQSSFERFVFQHIGRLPVSDVTTAHVLSVLGPIWTARPTTARRVRQRISAVMRWSVAQGYRGDDPAGDVISKALPRTTNGPKVHMRAVPHGDVGGVLEKVRQSDAWPATKLALEYLVLTAARSGEVRLAAWPEVDLEARTWEIPAARTKTNRPHRVPLSNRAVEVLREVGKYADGSGLIFPSMRGKPLSDNTLSKLLRDLGVHGVPHGFRSSFRDWAADTGQSREAAESALAHVIRGVEGAYARSDLFRRRRQLMADWAAYLDGQADSPARQ